MLVEIGMLIKDIPKDYVYDTETSEYVVYRNKYNGHEMKVVRSLDYIPIELYEQLLNAVLIAMLTELQLDIEKHTMTSGVTNQGTWNECIACCSRVIQQKINALKENKDGNDD